MTNEVLKTKICDIIAPYVAAYGDDEAIANALIAAGIGDKSRHRLFISKDGTVCKQLYSCEEVEQIAKERDEYKHRAEVAELLGGGERGMTKCGKSFLPECEYFATNGCVSPFNCPYKIENESITTATSTPCNHYPLETDKDKEISRLQAEVAELRARLEKAAELPRIVHPNANEWFVQYQNEYGLIFDEILYSERAAEARLKELRGGEK